MKLFFKKIFDLKLLHKLLFLYGAICLLLVLCSGAFFYYSIFVLQSKTNDISSRLVRQVGINLEAEIDYFSDHLFSTYHVGTLMGGVLRQAPEENRSSQLRQDLAIQKAQSEILYSVSDINWVCSVDSRGKSRLTIRPTAPDAVGIQEYALQTVNICRQLSGTLYWDILPDNTVAVSRMLYNLDTMQYVGTITIGIPQSFFETLFQKLGFRSPQALIVCDSSGDAMLTYPQELQNATDIVQQTGHGYTSPDNTRYVLTESTMTDSGLRLIQMDNISLAKKQIWDMAVIFALICLGTLIAITFLTALILTRLGKNVQHVMQGIASISQGNLQTTLTPLDRDEIGQIGLAINKMTVHISSLLQKVEEDAALLQQAEYQRLMSQYHVLQSQMNPHFLFNALETINALAKIHGDEQVCVCTRKLAQLFRNNLERTTMQCPLSEELEYIHNYIAVCQEIYSGRFHIHEHWNHDWDELPVPTFFLQPIVENAIIHGLSKKLGMGNLLLSADIYNERLVIRVEDDGVGMDAQRLAAVQRMDAEGTHFGLQSINERIQLLYGEEYGMLIYSKPGIGTLVEVTLPI